MRSATTTVHPSWATAFRWEASRFASGSNSATLSPSPGIPVVPTPLEPDLIQKVRTLYCSAGALLKPAEDMAFIKHQNKKDDSLL